MYCKECKRFWKVPHAFEECVIAQVHDEEQGTFDKAFNEISNMPLKPATLYMSQKDFDDIVEWSHSNK